MSSPAQDNRGKSFRGTEAQGARGKVQGAVNELRGSSSEEEVWEERCMNMTDNDVLTKNWFASPRDEEEKAFLRVYIGDKRDRLRKVYMAAFTKR